MAWVLIATDDFVHLKRRFAAVDGRGSGEATERAMPTAGDRGYNALSTNPDGAWTEPRYRN